MDTRELQRLIMCFGAFPTRWRQIIEFEPSTAADDGLQINVLFLNVKVY